MDLKAAEQLATQLMEKHGLEGWKFLWDDSRKHLGCCFEATQTIHLSYLFTFINPSEIVLDTILHEIAHALTPEGPIHGKKWKQKAVELGCQPEKNCEDSESLEPRWLSTCPACGNVRKGELKHFDLTYCQKRGCYETEGSFTTSRWSKNPECEKQINGIKRPEESMMFQEPTPPAPTESLILFRRETAKAAALTRKKNRQSDQAFKAIRSVYPSYMGGFMYHLKNGSLKIKPRFEHERGGICKAVPPPGCHLNNKKLSSALKRRDPTVSKVSTRTLKDGSVSIVVHYLEPAP